MHGIITPTHNTPSTHHKYSSQSIQQRNQWRIVEVTLIGLIIQSALINLIAMSLTKSSSLPEIRVNYNKYDQFFSRKSIIKEDMALEEGEPEEYRPSKLELATSAKKKAHFRNLQVIDRKSSIKSKVETYLTDSRKMGILDHGSNETNNRRSLARISLESLKPARTPAEQQKAYLKQLKSEINEYSQKSQKGQREIKNTQAMVGQVKQKIAYYDGILKSNQLAKTELLKQREENIVYIRYESDRLKFMQQRLRDINNLMKLRVKLAQKTVKDAENEAKILNDKESMSQEELNNKLYLQRQYENFETGKSIQLEGKTDKAMINMQVREAASTLKRHQDGLSIMTRDMYEVTVGQEEHNKLLQNIMAQQFYKRLLQRVWHKVTAHYADYEKAEELMLMHALDRKKPVQESYLLSFEMKKEVEEKITFNQKKLTELQARNKELEEQYGRMEFGEIREVEENWESKAKNVQTGKELEKNVKEREESQTEKDYERRHENIKRCKHLLTRLRQWARNKQKDIGVEVSKRSPLEDQYTELIAALKKQLEAFESDFNPDLKTTQSQLMQSKVGRGAGKRKK